MPELGLAVADAYQGMGLGGALLRLLEAAARATGTAGALELTTMQTNARAKRAYERAGYECLGIIRNPVGCDVTAAFRGEVVATRFCDEFQMVRVLDDARREELVAALLAKQKRAASIFGDANIVAAGDSATEAGGGT